MGLMDEIQQQAVTRNHLLCTVAVVLNAADADDAADLTDALSNGEIPSAAIARALNKRGINLSAGTIQRHRRGECACA